MLWCQPHLDLTCYFLLLSPIFSIKQKASSFHMYLHVMMPTISGLQWQRMFTLLISDIAGTSSTQRFCGRCMLWLFQGPWYQWHRKDLKEEEEECVRWMSPTTKAKVQATIVGIHAQENNDDDRAKRYILEFAGKMLILGQLVLILRSLP